MNELTLKLKNEVVRQLTKNEQNMNSDYLVKGDKTYSRRQLAAEIENETQFGIEILTSTIVLAMDLTVR
jgi:hypothetical protein